MQLEETRNMLSTRLLLISFLLMMPLTVSAKDAPPLTTLLGVGLWSRPAYDGADTNKTTLIPVVRYYGHPWS